MVGSTLEGGPDWADGAITRGGHLVAREVDRGVIVALVGDSAAPVRGSQIQRSAHPISCTRPQAWQVFEDGYQRSAMVRCDPYQQVL